MSNVQAKNRSIGFRSRLETRLAPLLEQTRRELGDAGLAALTIEGLAAPITTHVSRLVSALVEGKPMQQAVLDRAWLAEHWSLFDHEPCEPALDQGLARLRATEHREGRQPRPPHWPNNVSRDDLAQALRLTRDRDAVLIADALLKGLFTPQDEDRNLGLHASLYVRPIRPASAGAGPATQGALALSEDMERAIRKWPILPCARVIGAYKMVLADLRKPAIAIDAGKVHHELMGGWSRAAKAGEVNAVARPDRIELVLPGAENKPAMLDLPLDGARLSEAFIEAIKEWRSFLGLRHWIALQALFSIQGKREGRVLWKLDDHLDALGLSRRWRMDPENRAAVAREVSLLTKMQLVVYRPDGTVRARHSVLMTATQIEVEREGTWLLEGLELQMHPWLYNGVRDQKTGQLGKHWHPAPPELAKVDHDKFRYALVLGLMLPMRWKWAWAQQGADHISFEAGKLLDLACIPRSSHNPSRAWEALAANLAELRRIGLLGHVRWEGEPDTDAARVHLYPADWLLDRTLQGLHPVEKALPPPIPSKGADLIAWRKARNLTQTQLAKLWKVGERTIRRAEDEPDKPLGRALLSALRSLRDEPPATPIPPLLEEKPLKLPESEPLAEPDQSPRGVPRPLLLTVSQAPGGQTGHQPAINRPNQCTPRGRKRRPRQPGRPKTSLLRSTRAEHPLGTPGPRSAPPARLPARTAREVVGRQGRQRHDHVTGQIRAHLGEERSRGRINHLGTPGKLRCACVTGQIRASPGEGGFVKSWRALKEQVSVSAQV